LGKMGDAAALGAVAIVAYIVWKMEGFSLAKLLGFQEPPPPGELNGIPGPAAAGGLNLLDLLGGLGNGNGRANGGGDSDSGGSTDLGNSGGGNGVKTVYVPVVTKTISEPTIEPSPITIHPTVEPDILTGMIARKPGFYAQNVVGMLDDCGGVNV
jgi:hypothetical protein